MSCKPKTRLEKILLVLVLLVTVALIALIVLFTLQQTAGPDACMSTECVKSAAKFMDLVDPSVDPCDDFYDFACGGFVKKSGGDVTTISSLDDLLHGQMNRLIEDPLSGEEVPRQLWMERQFYRKCMNTAEVDQGQNKVFLEAIKEMGGWPMLEGREWDGGRFNWMTATEKLRKLGLNYEYFFSFGGYHDNETGLYLLTISPAQKSILAGKDYDEEAYLQLMAQVAADLGLSGAMPPNTEFIHILNFQEKLDKIIEKFEQVPPSLMILADLSLISHNINWTQLANNTSDGKAVFNENTLVMTNVRGYVVELNELLFSKTTRRVQANFLVWKTIEHYSRFLTVRNLFFRFYKPYLQEWDNGFAAILGSRRQFCLELAKHYFDSVAEVAYVRKYVPPETREDVREMVENIRKELISKVKESDWIDDITKEVTERRLNNIKSYVGWSDFVFDEDFAVVTSLEGFELPVNASIIEMVRILEKRSKDGEFEIVNKNFTEIQEIGFERSPVMQINAAYLGNVKTLAIPACLLQGLPYDLSRPKFLNYGVIGSIIGHELTHGLFDVEHPSGSNGQHEEEKWWSVQTEKGYKERQKCVVDEYESYSKHLPEFTKNGSVAFDENVADFVGPNLAYKAYRDWVSRDGEELGLPGTNYTSNQLFWIAFASYKCYQPNKAGSIAEGDIHGVPSFAVSGSVKNSPYFAADFNCPVGSKMNPAEKCKILE